MKRLPLHNLDPGESAADGDQVVVRDGKLVSETPAPPIGVFTIVLEHGQTISQWETVHGVTVPENTVIVELST